MSGEVNVHYISVTCCYSLGVESGHLFLIFMCVCLYICVHSLLIHSFIPQSDYNVQPNLKMGFQLLR